MIVFSTTAEKFFNEFFFNGIFERKSRWDRGEGEVGYKCPKNTKTSVKLYLKCFAIYRFSTAHLFEYVTAWRLEEFERVLKITFYNIFLFKNILK
jgi:hypothetical protein